MSIKSRKTWLAAGFTALLASGAPGFVTSGLMPVAHAQSQKFTGTVVDEFGDPVIGANIRVKGTNNGAITDMDGKFSVDAKAGAELEISFIGYATQTVAAGPNLNVTLKEDSHSLDDVVVVGYGVQKKKLVTGATVQVKGDDIAKMNTTQALGALQSQTPGVNIQAVSGKPGEGFKVTIRGAGTNGNTAPLYVIDGVSGGNINDINPADIESIDVLKDAASCAIYGSAAANGVILITTKQGKAGKIQVSYDGNVGWQNIYKLPDMLTAKEYMQVQDLARFNSGLPAWDWKSYFKGYEDLYESYMNGSNPGTNWVEEIRNKNAVTTSHALNIAGGSDKSKFSVGAGYQYQDGIIGGDIAPTDYGRFTFRINSEHVLLKGDDGRDIVKVGENLYYRHKKEQGFNNSNQYANPLATALRAAPIVPVYNKNGGYFAFDDFKSTGLFDYNTYLTNPVYAMKMSPDGNNESRSYGLNAVAYLEIQPIKNLIYRGQLSYNQSSWSYRSYSPIYKINEQGDFRTSDSATNSTGLGFGWSTTNTLNYRFDISENHFDVLVGTEWSMSKPSYGMSLSATSSDAVVGDLKHAYMDLMKNNKTAAASGSPYGDTRGMSYFGRVNYNYAERYMFSAIFRADGSSAFAPGKRWGYFPSFSAGWVMSEEAFMESTKEVMDYFKLRAGWGQNGNKNVAGAFAYEAAFGYDAYSNYSFGTDSGKLDVPTSGASLTRLANPDLTWETSEQLNVGFDARFLQSRLNMNFDWYKKTTKDLLVYVPVSPTTGFSEALKNAGTVENKGIEVALSWNDKIGNDFNYHVGANMSYNKNEVTKVNSDRKYNPGGNKVLSEGTTYIARFEEGQPIGYFWGYKTAGVIQNTTQLNEYINKHCGGKIGNSLQGDALKVGDLMFVDYNGDGKINDDDKTNIGDPNPDVTLGINLGFDWKGLDFSVTGYAALGQQVAYAGYRKFADSGQDNFTSEVYGYWVGEGTSNKYPLFNVMNTGMNWQTISDIYMHDASYFRLQNITVGYDFKNLLPKMPLSQCRLYVQAQNLFTCTKYVGMDPENGKSIASESWVTGVDVGNYPNPRTYVIGVNVKF
ncbi:MAG: TonB-dependent receptor [Bacteroidales bacterium]|nr:TonB-dependent receptor [Bacteroidales bacterium]